MSEINTNIIIYKGVEGNLILNFLYFESFFLTGYVFYVSHIHRVRTSLEYHYHYVNKNRIFLMTHQITYHLAIYVHQLNHFYIKDIISQQVSKPIGHQN